MKMGPDCIICSRVCFHRGEGREGRDNGIKSENWRALITGGLRGRTRAPVGGESGMWWTIRGWVSVTGGSSDEPVKNDEGRAARGTGRVLPRPREGEANRRSRWTPLCNLFPFASASRTNVGSTGGSPRATRPDEPILYPPLPSLIRKPPLEENGENFKKIANRDKSNVCVPAQQTERSQM